jgi:hypothetical protein
MHVLTYPQWKLNRQIAYGVIGIVVGVLSVASVIWWKRADAKTLWTSPSAEPRLLRLRREHARSYPNRSSSERVDAGYRISHP